MILRFIIMAVVLALVFGGLYGFDVFRSQKIAEYFATYRPPPTPISADTVVAEDLPKRLPAIGSLAAVHQVTVTSEVGGLVQIAGLPLDGRRFRPGERVKIRTGALEGREGQYASERRQGRAQIEVRLLGRVVKIEVPIHALAAIAL